MAIRKFICCTLYAIIIGLAILVSFVEKSKAFELQGWWGFSPNGCFDVEDNQYRVAIGRVQVKEGKVIFGRGKPGIWYYNSNCQFLKTIALRNRSVFPARCTDEDGSKFNTRITLVALNSFTMNVCYPKNSRFSLDVRSQNENY